MADANSIRRETDLKKLRELCDNSSGKIILKSAKGVPVDEITIEIKLNTAPSNKYPNERQSSSLIAIQLSSRYPLQEPTANIRTSIYHPNVYGSGKICFGQKWLPTEGLDLLVKRIIKIVTYDPTILNENSPANRDALEWYKKAIKTHPTYFPTDHLSINNNNVDKSIKWTTIQEEKVLVNCEHCRTGLRLPKGKTGAVKCPSCSKSFKCSS